MVLGFGARATDGTPGAQARDVIRRDACESVKAPATSSRMPPWLQPSLSYYIMIVRYLFRLVHNGLLLYLDVASVAQPSNGSQRQQRKTLDPRFGMYTLSCINSP